MEKYIIQATSTARKLIYYISDISIQGINMAVVIDATRDPEKAMVFNSMVEANMNIDEIQDLLHGYKLKIIHVIKYTSIQQRYWYYLGKYLGYPDCCVEAFLNGSSDRDDNIHKSNGFLPCISCANKIRAKEIKIEDLIIDRKHDIPYPNINQQKFDLYKNIIDKQINEDIKQIKK